jgi:ATP-dependent Clp protease ATP-binding subunit ClpA
MALFFCFVFSCPAVSPPRYANTITSNADCEGVCDTQNAAGVLLNKTPMNTASNTSKLIKLHELDTLLPREIRGQGQVLPRIISAVKRGELNLTKPGRPRGSFLLLGPTGVGKTETVVVLTEQIFGAQKLFRFDMSEFQTQESLGLLLGAKLGETGHLGAVRERAAEGSILFDEAEKAHPRVLDVLLQLLDAARITMATGQTLDFSGFYIWLTSNIGSAELMSLQHSNEATLERHVLSRAQQVLRPEIFARINEKLVFNRLSYEHQLEIAGKFLSREIEFLATRGHKLELEKAVLPFLVRKGFHPKLGARPMRDAVERLVGDAIAECLLAGRPACGALIVDEPHGCLVVR